MKQSKLSIGIPYISDFAYKLNPNFKDNPGVDMPIGLGFRRHIEDNKCHAILSVQFFGPKMTDDMPFMVLACIESDFIADVIEGEDPQDIIKQLTPSMASILYSYIRPLVAQITALSKYGTLHIPLIDISEIKVEDY